MVATLQLDICCLGEGFGEQSVGQNRYSLHNAVSRKLSQGQVPSENFNNTQFVQMKTQKTLGLKTAKLSNV